MTRGESGALLSAAARAPATMQRICIIGAGQISKIYTATLCQRFRLSYVDPAFSEYAVPDCYVCIDDVPEDVFRSFDYYVVSTPTDLHVGTVKEILQRNPHAHIVVEKPLASHRMFAALKVAVQRYPMCRIIENCQYAQSSLIERILDLSPEIRTRRHTLRSVYIEMTKNRDLDNRNGRTRDGKYHLLGYEGPHMIALADRLMRMLFRKNWMPGLTISCIGRHVRRTMPLDEGTARFEFCHPQLPRVQFHTSTIGEIGDRVATPKQRILAGDPERYRIVRLNFAEFSIIVRMEPQEAEPGTLTRNLNSIYRLADGKLHGIAEFSLNIFRDAVHRNLADLASSTFDVNRSLVISREKLQLLERAADLFATSPDREIHDRRSSGRVAVRPPPVAPLEPALQSMRRPTPSA